MTILKYVVNSAGLKRPGEVRLEREHSRGQSSNAGRPAVNEPQTTEHRSPWEGFSPERSSVFKLTSKVQVYSQSGLYLVRTSVAKTNLIFLQPGRGLITGENIYYQEKCQRCILHLEILERLLRKSHCVRAYCSLQEKCGKMLPWRYRVLKLKSTWDMSCPDHLTFGLNVELKS